MTSDQRVGGSNGGPRRAGRDRSSRGPRGACEDDRDDDLPDDSQHGRGRAPVCQRRRHSGWPARRTGEPGRAAGPNGQSPGGDRRPLLRRRDARRAPGNAGGRGAAAVERTPADRLLVALLVGGIGFFVSIHASTAQEAQQLTGVGMMLPLVLASSVVMSLRGNADLRRSLEGLGSLDPALIVVAVMGLTAIVDGARLLAADRRFRRGRLLAR